MKGYHPVGALSDLESEGRAVVAAFRAFRGDPAHGADPLSDLCSFCARHCRRPLSAHGEGCPCLGGDEACLARFVELAIAGERDEALMLAMLLVRADLAPIAVALAEQAGLALRRATSVRPRPALH